LTFNALLQNNERTHKYDADAARGENARTNNPRSGPRRIWGLG
jgi:hypothetical protein